MPMINSGVTSQTLGCHSQEDTQLGKKVLQTYTRPSCFLVVHLLCVLPKTKVFFFMLSRHPLTIHSILHVYEIYTYHYTFTSGHNIHQQSVSIKRINDAMKKKKNTKELKGNQCKKMFMHYYI